MDTSFEHNSKALNLPSVINGQNFSKFIAPKIERQSEVTNCAKNRIWSRIKLVFILEQKKYC